MKKIFSIITAALIFLNTGGIFFIFLTAKLSWNNLVQLEIAKSKKEKSLVRLAFSQSEIECSNTDLCFVKKNEFIYKGIFYDIVSTVRNKDSVFYICYKDTKETLFIVKYNNYLSDNYDNKSQTSKNILNQFKLLSEYFITSLTLKDIHSSCCATEIGIINHYQSLTTDIATPPPRIFACILPISHSSGEC